MLVYRLLFFIVRLLKLSCMAQSVSTKSMVKYSSWQLVKDIFLIMRGQRRLFFVATIIRLVADLAGLFPIYAFAKIADFFVSYM